MHVGTFQLRKGRLDEVSGSGLAVLSSLSLLQETSNLDERFRIISAMALSSLYLEVGTLVLASCVGDRTIYKSELNLFDHPEFHIRVSSFSQDNVMYLRSRLGVARDKQKHCNLSKTAGSNFHVFLTRCCASDKAA